MADDLVKQLREGALEKQQEAWDRADGGQDLSIEAGLALVAADRIEELEARAERAEAERDALREAMVKADELAGAIENDVWQNTQTWFALTAYREARDALNREAGT